jgi:hypothetical protein
VLSNEGGTARASFEYNFRGCAVTRRCRNDRFHPLLKFKLGHLYFVILAFAGAPARRLCQGQRREPGERAPTRRPRARGSGGDEASVDPDRKFQQAPGGQPDQGRCLRHWPVEFLGAPRLFAFVCAPGPGFDLYQVPLIMTDRPIHAYRWTQFSRACRCACILKHIAPQAAKRDFGSVVQIGLFSATVRARRGKNRPFGQGLAPAPAVQVKPRFETAGFRVFQNFREFPRVVLRKVQRRYGLRSSTSWHSSLSVRLFEGHGIFGGRWTSRLWHGRDAGSMRSASGDALDLTRCEDRRRHCHV